MASQISLTSGMRNNLFSLQMTAGLINQSQNRLSSGKKVNSPLDNPTNFFAAQSHLNRASDLKGTKDGVMEAIQTIRAASVGITALTSLLETMKGVVSAAKSTSDSASKAQYAKTFDEIYSQLNSVASDSSYRGTNLIGNTDTGALSWNSDDLSVKLNESGSSQFTVAGNFLGSGYALYESGTPDVGWVANDNGTNLTSTTDVPPTITKLDFVFVLDVTGSMDSSLNQVKTNVATFINDLQAQNVDGRFAFATYGEINDGDAPVITAPTFFTDPTAFTAALTTATTSANRGSGGGDFPESGLEGILTTMSDLSFRSDATKRMVLITDATVHATSASGGDGLSVDTIAGTASALTAAGIQLDIAGASGSVRTQLEPLATATGGSYHNITDSTFFSTGFGYTAPSEVVPTSNLVIQAADYDSGNFTISFNNSSPATVRTMTVDKSGLGLLHSWLYDGFETAAGADAAGKDIENAMGIIRAQSARFGSGLDILTTRDTFTTEMTNLLTGGADNLTLADMNEEGTNMLMLQTRQSLGISSLSMAAQAAQSVMRLF